MNFKSLPKEYRDTESGEVYGRLVTTGHEPFDYKGKTVMVRKCYYQCVSADGYPGDFTTTESDTLWLALLVEACLNRGMKLSAFNRWQVGNYKRYKFNRKRG